MREAVKLVIPYVVVMSAASAALAALDRVPALLTGATHGARVYRTVEAAEAETGRALLLPSYYPDVLAWPPKRVEAIGHVVAIRISGRETGDERLVICQSLDAAAPLPMGLLADAEETSVATVSLGGRRAKLARLVTPGGKIVHDLSWFQDGRAFTVRYDGPVRDLLRMGESLGRAKR